MMTLQPQYLPMTRGGIEVAKLKAVLRLWGFRYAPPLGQEKEGLWIYEHPQDEAKTILHAHMRTVTLRFRSFAPTPSRFPPQVRCLIKHKSAEHNFKYAYYAHKKLLEILKEIENEAK